MSVLVRRWFWVLMTASAYGLLNGLLAGLKLPGAPIIALRPQVVLPMAVGVLVGPFAGFLAGALGNGLGDLFAGLGATYWDWHIGNGMIGLIPGLLVPRSCQPVRSIGGVARILLAVVLANGVGLCVGILIDGLVLNRYGAAEALLGWYLPAVVTNVLFGLLLLPLALVVSGRLVMTVETRTSLAVTSLLVVAVVAVTAAVAGGFSRLLAGLPEVGSHGGALAAATLASLRWAGALTLAVLLPALAVSLWLTRRITAPLARLTTSAQSLEAGRYELAELRSLEGRDDELGKLATAFVRMSSSVQRRETELRQQISELRVVIDRDRATQEAHQITETEYFKTLEQKAQALRRRRTGTAQSPAAGEREQG